MAGGDRIKLGSPSQGRRLHEAAKCYLWSIVPLLQQDRSLNLKASLLSFFQLSQAMRQEGEAQMPNGDKHKVGARDAETVCALGGGVQAASLPSGTWKRVSPEIFVLDQYCQFYWYWLSSGIR